MFVNYVGQLLISMPHLKDPFFKKTVTLICEFNKISVLGFILNKPFLDIKLDTLFKNLKITNSKNSIKDKIYIGGPVYTNQGFIIHSTDKEYEDTQIISNDLRLSTSINALEDIANKKPPRLYKIFLGCSSWGYQQFNNEMLENSWHLSNSSKKIIFNDKDNKDDLWEYCVADSGIDKFKLTPFHGKA